MKVFIISGLDYLVRSVGRLEKDQVGVDFQKLIFQDIFPTFKSVQCPSSMHFKTHTKSVQGRGTGTHTEIIIIRMLEFVRVVQKSSTKIKLNYAMAVERILYESM